MSYYKISKFFLYLVPLGVVVVSRGTLFPFIVGKYAAFRTLTYLALIFFLLGVIFENAEWPATKGRMLTVMKNPLVIAIGIFAMTFLLASFFSYDPAASFWSNFERGEGGLQILTLYIFFLLTLFLLRREHDWKKLLKISLISAVLMILYGVLGAFGVQGFLGVPLNFSNRFEGSLGNPEYVGPYLAFSIFFALYFFIHEERRFIRWLLAALIAFFLVFFIMSQTRGAFCGFAAGIVAFLIYMAVVEGGNWRRWGIAILAALIILGGAGIYFGRTGFVQKLPGRRLLDISLAEIEPRILVWSEAIKGFEARPVFGWGPGNFSVVFDRYFNPAIYTGPISETWFDRAHDIFLDYASETGAFGLLSYLGILATFFVLLFKRFHLRRNERSESSYHHVALTGLFIAVIVQYIVQGLVIFDVLPIYLVLYLTLALFTFKALEHNRNTEIPK